ncbi:hypothetical protein OAD25_03070 [Gammaproteobacteria bacterium]|nr:hypothetical protein [Gammaproteobacteria bacterium]
MSRLLNDDLINQNKIIFIIQARMGSTRLPRKVMRNIIGNYSMLEVLICRLLVMFPKKTIWLATTQNQDELPILELANKYGLNIFQGEEDDVLSRFENICHLTKAKWVVRITGDNPLICSKLCIALIKQAINSKAKISHISDKKYQRKFPQGLVPEIVRVETLLNLRKIIPIDQRYHLSHVTSIIDETKKEHFVYKDIPALAGLRLTVDEQSDFDVISKILNIHTGDWRKLDINDINNIRISNPNIFLVNKNVKQKDLSHG